MTEPSGVTSTSTFVLRFWREWSTSQIRWRGRIEHVQSGRHANFVQMEELLHFIDSHLIMAEDRTGPTES